MTKISCRAVPLLLLTSTLVSSLNSSFSTIQSLIIGMLNTDGCCIEGNYGGGGMVRDKDGMFQWLFVYYLEEGTVIWLKLNHFFAVSIGALRMASTWYLVKLIPSCCRAVFRVHGQVLGELKTMSIRLSSW
ncbi:hypothetical protein MTR67_012550 [Solanum verrucosum]|uniref:Uncharacterized protein n=1 Tax=Solanum verrucosum TaxID=315347 RepID=A0AAF0TN00_SOLVR|nr:hypothetical protein MTR67_012550 [Solanum verrucosum]